MRPPCADKTNNGRGPWATEEDPRMIVQGNGNWSLAPRRAGLRRCGKSCKPRWSSYHQPDSKHEIFTPQEEELIIRLHVIIGSRWSIIAQQLPGRTDNDVKNHWNTKLRKKLKEMGIDPVTHKPFSQVLRDYGNIGGTPRESRIGSSDQPQAFSDLNTRQMPPKVASRTETDTARDNHSLDLLAQLHTIKLVTEASTCSAHGERTFMPSDTSSSPPTSSSSAGSAAPQSFFSWSDFLIEDAALPAELSNEGIRMRPQDGEVDREAGEESNGTGGFHKNGTSNGLKGSSIPSSDGSFVESILSQNEEMFMEFPELWEEPHY
ncbi:transcription factor MYB35-like [Rhodamnia argentea]|uniref:Transcription factor MYB35-like n=1 Tax=Rhodamnia argentea TaxID=178133 RepID=A0A8B8NHS5_9MYRT|nr:transcription factor MYB35-like [Rhodamnia argentea]